MKKLISKMLLIALLLGHLLLNAQIIKPLKVGDKVPDIVLEKMINHASIKGRLSDFSGKALIIDQWFISCAPCVGSMPKMDSLQKEFAKNLQVLPVTFEKKNAVDDFWANNIIVKGIKFTQVVEDTLVRTYFPAISFPQQVWIDKNRIVVAITDGKGANRENIKKLIDGDKLLLFLKKDELDGSVRLAEEPNIISRYEQNKKKLLYYSYFSKNRPELSGVRFAKVDTINNLVRVVNNNNSLVGLYNFAYKDEKNGYGIEMSHEPTRLLRRDHNPIKSKASGRADSIFRFCYELIYPGNAIKGFSKYMISDLDRFFNLKSHEELLDIECYVIKPNGQGTRYFDTYQPDRKPYWTISLQVAKRILINNSNLRMAEQRINDLSEFPVLLEIEGGKSINLDVKWDLLHLDKMNDDLIKFDLMIEKTIRKRKVIILEDQ